MFDWDTRLYDESDYIRYRQIFFFISINDLGKINFPE